MEFTCENCGKVFQRKKNNTPLCTRCLKEKTCLEHFGAKSNLVIQSNPKEAWSKKHDEIVAKRRETSLNRFNCESPNQSREVIAKMQSSKKEREKNFEEKNDCVSVKSLVDKFGQGWRIAKVIDEYVWDGSRKYVPNILVPKIEEYFNQGRCHTNGYVSKKEKELVNFIKSIYNGKIVENDTSTVPNLNHRYYELDVYLPELRLAFDFDGNYYHSSRFKDKYYHQRKSLCCYRQKIRLAHVLEKFWDERYNETRGNIKRLIFENASFNDGLFPSNETDVVLSEPREIKVGKYSYYDTGVIE